MNREDFSKFSEIWQSAHELSSSNQKSSQGAVSMAFEIFARLSLEQVTKAILMHTAKSRFAPTPADILAVFEKQAPKHYKPDEAWAVVLQSFDESQTVVMTQEMIEARGVALDVWNEGDKVGARMAFKSAYERLVERGGNPVWKPSYGFDPKHREIAITKAVNAGLLPESEIALITHNREPVVSFKQLVDMSESKNEYAKKLRAIIEEAG